MHQLSQCGTRLSILFLLVEQAGAPAKPSTFLFGFLLFLIISSTGFRKLFQPLVCLDAQCVH